MSRDGVLMKKQKSNKLYIILICCAVFVCVFGWRYHLVNKEWQRSEVTNVPMGDTFHNDQFQITIENASMMSEADSDEQMKKTGAYMMNADTHFRIINITLRVKNTGSEPLSSETIFCNLVTGAYANAFMISDDDRLLFPLESGKEVTITGSSQVPSTAFNSSQWKNIEKRKYCLCLSVYPEVTNLLFDFGQ